MTVAAHIRSQAVGNARNRTAGVASRGIAGNGGTGPGDKTPSRPAGARTVQALLAAVVVLLAVLGSAPAASAHDVVETTNPADGSTVATLPAAITITLDNTPGALGSSMQVKDASGRDWAQGKVQVVDHVASQQLAAGAPAGKYTVLWRLVSSDSHPIEGSFTFTASSGAAGASASSGTASDAASGPAGGATGSASEATTTASAPAAQPSAGFPWGIALTILVLVLAVAALGIFAKRRLNRADE